MEFRSVSLEVLNNIGSNEVFGVDYSLLNINQRLDVDAYVNDNFKPCSCHELSGLTVNNCVTELKSMPSHIKIIDVAGQPLIVPLCGISLTVLECTDDNRFQLCIYSGDFFDISESEYNRISEILLGG